MRAFNSHAPLRLSFYPREITSERRKTRKGQSAILSCQKYNYCKGPFLTRKTLPLPYIVYLRPKVLKAREIKKNGDTRVKHISPNLKQNLTSGKITKKLLQSREKYDIIQHIRRSRVIRWVFMCLAHIDIRRYQAFKLINPPTVFYALSVRRYSVYIWKSYI